MSLAYCTASEQLHLTEGLTFFHFHGFADSACHLVNAKHVVIQHFVLPLPANGEISEVGCFPILDVSHLVSNNSQGLI